jgi:cell division transport system permease protein
MIQILAQHRHALGLVLNRIRRAPTSWVTMAVVIGVTLALPAMLFVAINNLQRLTGDFQTSPQISVFMKTGATSDEVKVIEAKLRAHDGVENFHFISRETAWKDMQQSSGLAEVAAGLEQNPLPDAFVVDPRSTNPAFIEGLQLEIEQWPAVEHAQLDAAWVKRLYGLLQIGNKLVLVIAGLLGIALLIITGNSIRLQIATQHDEIELSRLIGATDRFIRRPFLYAGVLYGLGGGLAALLLVFGATWLFNDSVAEVARLYASDFQLKMPTPDVCLALIVSAALLGWLGAYIAVSRALAKVERY